MLVLLMSAAWIRAGHARRVLRYWWRFTFSCQNRSHNKGQPLQFWHQVRRDTFTVQRAVWQYGEPGTTGFEFIQQLCSGHSHNLPSSRSCDAVCTLFTAARRCRLVASLPQSLHFLELRQTRLCRRYSSWQVSEQKCELLFVLNSLIGFRHTVQKKTFIRHLPHLIGNSEMRDHGCQLRHGSQFRSSPAL